MPYAGSDGSLRQSTYRGSGPLGRKSKRGPDGARGLGLQTKRGTKDVADLRSASHGRLLPFSARFSPPRWAGYAADDTIKIGVLHSLSGTMAISETTLKDTVLYLIDEQNKKGGILGKKLEAVVVDPASNWPLFAEKARELISQDKVSVVFGCWTSVSRKSVLPGCSRSSTRSCFYPVQYEGEESERNVFYTGAAPNQQAIPAVDYLMKEEGVQRLGASRYRLCLPAHHQTRFSRPISRPKGVAADDIMINYTPFGHSDWQSIVADIKKFGSAGKKTAVVSTINGDGQRTVLQGTRQPGASRPRISRLLPSRWVRRNWPVSIPSHWSAISPPGTISNRSTVRPTPPSSTAA